MSPRRKRNAPTRTRVGSVSVYSHHGAWWVYYREHGRPVCRKVGNDRAAAEQIAAQVNAQLAGNAPTMLAFTPCTIPELRWKFLDLHANVLNFSMATVNRYRTATKHLENYASSHPRPPMAHEVQAHGFASYLRCVEVAPNGHPHLERRRLRDKGLKFVLETCRSLLNFAAKQRHLPPYAVNPFTELPLYRLKIEDAKAIFVFDAPTELAFFRRANDWAFPIHFTLAKAGLRRGELVHLLIEELDLDHGWLFVRNKKSLEWRIKTGAERRVPLLSESVAVLKRVIRGRPSGPVFLRERFSNGVAPVLSGGLSELERECNLRTKSLNRSATREDAKRIAAGVWRDAGAVKPDSIRTSFIRVMRQLGRSDATCPKSWRHSFATLLQDANVDPLIRQLTLGHKPTSKDGLGMTAVYTHTRLETQRRQIEQALRQWPETLEMAKRYAEGGASC